MQEGSGLESGASLRRTDGGVRPYVIFGGSSFVHPHVVFGVAMLGAHGGWGSECYLRFNAFLGGRMRCSWSRS